MMYQKNTVKQLVADKWKCFCQHSSLHGVVYFYRRNHWSVYVTWSLIIALDVVLCVFLSHMIWTKYSVDPTFTVVESSRYPTLKIPFPSVIVCDSEIVYRPNTKNITYILKLRGFEAKQIDAFYKSFEEIQQTNYTIEPDTQRMHYILHELGYTYIKLLGILNKPCDQLLVKCAWRSKTRACEEMFRQVYTYRGFCCQFDIPYFKAHASDNETSFVSGAELSEALDFTVDGQEVATDGTRQDGHVSVYILDEEHKLTNIDNSIKVTPGGIFDINVYVWAIDSAPEVGALPLAYRNCLLDSDPTVWPNYYEGCLARILLQKIVNSCHCLPFNVTSVELHVDGFPVCTWDRLKCIYDGSRNPDTDRKDLGIEGTCLVKCDYVQYDTETEFVMLKRRYVGTDGSNSHVYIHFTGDSCMKYRREVLYTWDQMLANLGGIFGLCLGGSIISIIELLWFVFELVCEVLSALLRKNNNKVPKKTNKIFTLTEKNYVRKVSAKKNKKVKFVQNYSFVH